MGEGEVFVNAEELYLEIKNALSAFGLHFRDMAQMRVSVDDGRVVFSHEDRIYSVKVG
jgi:hypothetical protein